MAREDGEGTPVGLLWCRGRWGDEKKRINGKYDEHGAREGEQH